MGLSMGLSGMFNIGHDIGGFAGPTPDAELLVRWMQACALNPRCIMNSWKDDGSVNTPWLHPDATAHIRAAIELRLSLLPYLYSCLHESVGAHRPVLRPTFFEFPNDPQCWQDNDEFLVGTELLAAPVLDAGSVTRSLYLPQARDTPGWRCFHTGAWYPSGQTIEVAAPIERLPLFVRSNAVLPTTDTTDWSRRTDEPSRALRLYPAPANAPSRTSTPWVEDDGVSLAWQAGAMTRITATLGATAESIQLNLRREGEYPLPCDRVRLVLPAGEARAIDWTSQALELFA
jgi:alpha-glucosidase